MLSGRDLAMLADRCEEFHVPTLAGEGPDGNVSALCEDCRPEFVRHGWLIMGVIHAVPDVAVVRGRLGRQRDTAVTSMWAASDAADDAESDLRRLLGHGGTSEDIALAARAYADAYDSQMEAEAAYSALYEALSTL